MRMQTSALAAFHITAEAFLLSYLEDHMALTPIRDTLLILKSDCQVAAFHAKRINVMQRDSWHAKYMYSMCHVLRE